MRQTGRNIGRRLADLIHDEIKGLSDAEIRMLLRHLKTLTTTNCGWDVYAMRNAVADMARAHLKSRAYQKSLEKREVQP